jgi:hypothetical protein
MHFRFDVAAPGVTMGPTPPAGDANELLKQLLEVQREQLHHLRQMSAAHDPNGRWRAFWSRWQSDFPNLPTACRTALPHLERAYITLIADLTDHLGEVDSDPLDNDFALSEFLDKFGMRLNQLGILLSLVGPLADQPESSGGTG